MSDHPADLMTGADCKAYLAALTAAVPGVGVSEFDYGRSANAYFHEDGLCSFMVALFMARRDNIGQRPYYRPIEEAIALCRAYQEIKAKLADVTKAIDEFAIHSLHPHQEPEP